MPPLSGRHHNLLPSVSAMVSAGSRIYYIMDEAPIGVRGPGGRWSLIARDAFNGLLLWKRPMEKWGWQHWSEIQVSGLMRFKGPDQLYRRLVAVEDVLYATVDFFGPVVAIDGATGEILRTYAETENTAEILHSNGILFLTQNVSGDQPGKNILAVDAETGELLWKRTGYSGITSRGDELQVFTDSYLTIGDDKVFFLNEDQIVALDSHTGREAWRHPRPGVESGVFGHYRFNFAHLCTLVHHKGLVFLAQIHPNAANLNAWQEKDVTLLTLNASTGDALWEHTGMTLAHFTPPDLFVTGDMVWTMEKGSVSLCGLDLRTGAVKRRYPVKDMLVGHHHRCYRNKATEQFYLAGEEGIEYIRFDSGELDVHHWLRGACGYGLLPANGLIYMPTHACGCHANVKLNGFLALRSPDATDVPTSQPRAADWHDRLERGPAFASEVATGRAASVAGDQWPVYRHDSRRSNWAATDVPIDLEELWNVDLGGKLTAPVIADRKVFFAASDRNTIFCLGAERGERRWQFTTDGPVDSPPTYHAGRLVVGTRGGSVYALDPDRGELIWRFQAAPRTDRLMAFSRLESPWPVHGSVLVKSDRVYCVAGRSMHLDSGLHVYALDLATGSVVQQARLQADLGPKGELGDAVLPDVLVSDGADVYMRQLRFEGGDLQKRGRPDSQRFLRVNDGGLLDTTWINNTFWKYGQMQAQMIAFDDRTAYGIKGAAKLISKSYGQDVFVPGQQGYSLYAVTVGEQTASVSDGGRDKRRGRVGLGESKREWDQRVSVRARCLVVTNGCLFVAGIPDVMDPRDPWAAFDDRKGGLLQAYSKTDGQKLAEYQLERPPVFDGLAAAYGRLYAATTGGRIMCWGGRENAER
jgi:outer membrane protein assembly factor BamB